MFQNLQCDELMYDFDGEVTIVIVLSQHGQQTLKIEYHLGSVITIYVGLEKVLKRSLDLMWQFDNGELRCFVSHLTVSETVF